MVTGTTASSGDHSIITVRVGFPVACWANCARYSVCPGAGKPLSYSTDLATGFVTRPAARPVTTSATAWRIDAIAAGPLPASGRPACAVTSIPSGTTGSAFANAAAAACGSTLDTGTGSCNRRARFARNSASLTV